MIKDPRFKYVKRDDIQKFFYQSGDGGYNISYIKGLETCYADRLKIIDGDFLCTSESTKVVTHEESLSFFLFLLRFRVYFI